MLVVSWQDFVLYYIPHQKSVFEAIWQELPWYLLKQHEEKLRKCGFRKSILSAMFWGYP